jgi:hypothetical protein
MCDKISTKIHYKQKKAGAGRSQIYRPPIPRVAIPVSALARGWSRTGVPAPTESRPDHPLRNHYTTLPTLYMLDEPTNDEVPPVCCAAIVRRFTIQHRHIVHTSGHPCGDHTASHQSTTPLNFCVIWRTVAKDAYMCIVRTPKTSL